MTDAEYKELKAYLIEMRRHQIAMVKATERLLSVVIEQEKCYTKPVVELETE